MKIIEIILRRAGLNGGNPFPAINKLRAVIHDHTNIASILDLNNTGIAFNGLIMCLFSIFFTGLHRTNLTPKIYIYRIYLGHSLSQSDKEGGNHLVKSPIHPINGVI